MVTGSLPRSARSTRPRRPWRGEPDLTWYVGGTAAAVGVTLFILASIPADATTLNGDRLLDGNRYRGIVMKPLAEKDDETPDWAKQKKAEMGENRGQRARGEEGKAGKKDAPKTNGRMAVKGDPTNADPHLGKASAADLARTAGILGAMHQQTSAMVSIFGRGDAVGRDAQSALGSLMGTDLVDNWGPGGLGIVGARRGGGGTGDGTYGFGPLGTIGLCRGPNCGPGTGHGYPPGIGGMPLTRRPSGPEAVGGQAKVIGGLDREIIRRTIRAHIKEVKFCYERELIRKPGLFGRVSVQFTITGMGAVSSAAVASSTIGDANVEGCITAAVRRWEFPHPENGGIVHVTYPFVLQAAGGAR